MRVIVYSEVAGYIWVELLDDGVLMDELGPRPDLLNDLNTQLIEKQMESDCV